MTYDTFKNDKENWLIFAEFLAVALAVTRP
jgi:hypothetical protein